MQGNYDNSVLHRYLPARDKAITNWTKIVKFSEPPCVILYETLSLACVRAVMVLLSAESSLLI